MKFIRNNEKAEASSYFAVEILYEGIFGHMTTFLICTHVKIVLIATTANIPITNSHLFAFILKVNLNENLQKQHNEAPSYFEWKP